MRHAGGEYDLTHERLLKRLFPKLRASATGSLRGVRDRAPDRSYHRGV
jgi:hypothetical protein